MDKRKSRVFPPLVIALVFLFNPNLSIIDILPDFVAFFILARLVLRASDISPYFEEARESFVKLGWLNLAKILGAVVIVVVRRGNTSDGDIITLVSVVFGICECILLIGAANNIFRALFYLGERSSATSLISPFPPDRHGRSFNADLLLSFTHLFSVIKCLSYALPTILLLTQNPDNTSVTVSPSAYFSSTMLYTAALTLIVGVIWLVRMLRYTSACVRSGDLSRALDEMNSERAEKAYEKKQKIRKISSALTLFAISALFSVELAFDNFHDISLVPNFLIGIFLLIALFRLSDFADTKYARIAAIVYTAASATFFLFDTRFKLRFDYSDLLTPGEASDAYRTVELLATLELVAFITVLILTVISFRQFIKGNTGLSPESERYSRADREFHGGLMKKTYVTAALAAISMISHFLSIFISGDIRILETELYDHSPVTLYMPSIPWFSLIVAASSIAFIAYTYYFTNLLKEEVRMKYSIE